VVVVAGAAAADLCLHDGIGGTGVTVCTVVVVAALVGTRLVTRRPAVAVAGAAVLLAVLWDARVSPWVRLPVGSCLGLCLLGAVFFGRRGDLFDVTWRRTLSSPAAVAVHAGLAPRWLGRGIAGRLRLPGRVTGPSLVRALVITVPLLGVVVGLLVSADPLFAAVVRAPFELRTLGAQAVAVVAGAAVAAVLARTAACEPPPAVRRNGGAALGAVEISAVLAAFAAVLALFVGVQIAATLGFGRHVLRGHGITYASYARSGYFQLLWVVGITVVVLTTLDALGGQHLRIARWASLVIVVLALAVEWSAVRRLVLYDAAYGLTMLRVSCLFGAAFMSLLLLLVAVRVSGVLRGRAWLPGACAVALVATVACFAAVNPERLVVDYDVGHRASAPLDVGYLAGLSGDAAPALVGAAPDLGPAQQRRVRAALCGRTGPLPGWAQASLPTAADRSAADRLCAGTGGRPRPGGNDAHGLSAVG